MSGMLRVVIPVIGPTAPKSWFGANFTPPPAASPTSGHSTHAAITAPLEMRILLRRSR